MYNGISVLQLTDQEVADLYNKKETFKFDASALYINQYVLLKATDGQIVGERRWNGEKLVPLTYSKFKDFTPKSSKQKCLSDLLCNKEIPIKIIAGCAGSGKSKFCIKYGLSFVEKEQYSKLFVVRHNVSVGEKNGFLPGSKADKIRGWLGFLEDNLDDTQMTIESLLDTEKLEVDSPEFMKGRDLKDAFILIDEAEDLTEAQFKMLGERTSGNSVICFVGDYEQTTQERYSRDSGLVRGINTLKGHPRVGIIVFDDKEHDNVRSEVSKIFSYIY